MCVYMYINININIYTNPNHMSKTLHAKSNIPDPRTTKPLSIQANVPTPQILRALAMNGAPGGLSSSASSAGRRGRPGERLPVLGGSRTKCRFRVQGSGCIGHKDAAAGVWGSKKGFMFEM